MKIPGDSVVSNKLNGVEAKTARIAPASAVNRRAGAPAESAGPAAESDADVQLTGAARGLAALEQAVRAMPAVDQARVAAARERISNGSYEVDPQRVADRLLRLESDLQHAAPLDQISQK
jgi:negative regulator of flagellin synthesis FlgM